RNVLSIHFALFWLMLLTAQVSAAADSSMDEKISAGSTPAETLTGFPERLGALLGLPAMPMSFFLIFNLAWLVIWVFSVPGLRAARAAAFFAAWLLAIAGMVNAIAHPLLAVAAGGYFPGLVTSPFIAAAAVWLWIRLREATEPPPNFPS
ncbi:MAG: hypothetical protein OEM92_05265, partial [Gammaproteobacteria bacterium]|nr:hypothetical protein [Gammaproteobacteria bacterium]